MLGILISESAEILYSLVKLTYDTGKGIYCWYYDEENPKDERNKDKKIHELENRIVSLEKKIKNNNDY
tara:strand:- start:414 stop:617 length:204 start_codon:yes stop_codon:yes gene_type:complete